MTVNGSSLMASQVYANKNVQAQSGASGYATQGASADFSAMAQQLMSTMDTNKSGSIDKAEFSQAAQALSKNATNSSSSSIDTAFAKMDTNGDGQISSDEMMAALKQASTQTQGKHHHGGHHHHTDASASNSTSQSTQTNSSTQSSSTANDLQKSLFNKIMAAYSNTTASTGTTTNISA
jgi:glucan biosynthesis protein